jgi:hypothetical protein
MRTKHIKPVFCGFTFGVHELDNDGASDRYYGYHMEGNGLQEGGGCYESVELATRAVLQRIENLNFDLNRRAL